ncbi:5-formyltetrahydrofolate cyclo-ligase [Herbaspirillum seropedicae]|uniref:5-formyltetrahydrofolate cyclo-ligase n=1 Tax=Herbaspirillum seropedicae TaxID=964 RepID=UPI00285CFA92|nr:5-formyltetrahydrofolate cyclo-ligase [Herbaspirillum seropedicae]MDR6397667.1 5-formyltetrahydrofolate cyclo-ligase [Herbaspirillum seropedicae]
MNPSIARDTPAPSSETASLVLHKQQLRTALLARRKALDVQERERADARIGQRVLEWTMRAGVSSLAVYQPIRGEPDLAAAYNALAARGVHLCLPVVVEKDAPLLFRAWQPGDALQKDALGTLAPLPSAPEIRPQALLIPCVGFNAAGFRLGYGGGFYDRTLAGLPRPRAVGVCYRFGLAAFEAQAHDVPMEAILTDAD